MLRSHIDALGRHNSSVKQTLGVQLKPAAGSLVDPEQTVGYHLMKHFFYL